MSEPLDTPLKAMITESMSKRIDKDTKPGRNRSDVARDALEFYFEFRGKIMSGDAPKYRSKSKKSP